MGLHTDIDPVTDADVDDLLAADTLLAEALAQFSGEAFRKANRANRDTAGDWVPYSVTVDGKEVFRGVGDVWPENQIAVFRPRAKSQREQQREANVELGRQVRTIVVEWFWGKVEKRLLERLIRTLARIRYGAERVETTTMLGNILAGGEVQDLLAYLLERWGGNRSQILRGFQDARAAYKLYRLLGRIGGGGSADRIEGDDTRGDLLRWIATELTERSPVVSGTYKAGHVLYVDGRETVSAEDLVAGDAIPAGRTYAFVNREPYARRLETGKDRKGRPFLKQVPNHIYERVTEDARRQFADVALVRFDYVGLDERAGRTTRRTKSRYEILYPTIVVTFR